MIIVHTDEHRRHSPKAFLQRGKPAPNPEILERAEAIVAAVAQAGHTVIAPPDFGIDPLLAVHDAQYVEFLRTAYARWKTLPNAAEEIVPNVHPATRGGTRPEGILGQVGYYTQDTASPIGADTWPALLAVAHCAVHAADLVLGGEDAAYALCRPPGHHAMRDKAGGFCYLNNSAIAAQRLRQRYVRVAIVDVDVHHGNGTQDIFYERKDVFTASIHGDPNQYYPFYTGYPDERGAGPGVGYNLNVPYPFGSGDDAALSALDQAIEGVKRFEPEVLVVALGLDAFENDPFGAHKVTTNGFRKMAQRLAGLNVPTVLVQEGGYFCAELGDNVVQFLQPFASR
jgi:acetoin utilization deacetylase AcuC-like enzyme